MRHIEDCKASLDNKKLVGTLLMDLSKAFDCISHDLLIAKLHAHGLTTEALTFLYSYLKRRQQGVKINDAESIFKILLSGVPQGSILGPILFNVFINDLFLFINKTKLANFADDNTIYANSAEMETLLDILEKENETAIKWFKKNQMIVNPDKFQAMVLGRHRQKEKINLNINGAEIKGQNSVTLLGAEIGNELNFNDHISNICKKAGNKTNAISRIQSFLGQKEEEALVNIFLYSNLTIAHYFNKEKHKQNFT